MQYKSLSNTEIDKNRNIKSLAAYYRNLEKNYVYY